VSDNGPENRRTLEDRTGPVTSGAATRVAGRTWSASAWGSRGRRFKSCRPDRSSGRHLITRCRPELRKQSILRSSSRSLSVLSGRLIDGGWSNSGARRRGRRNGVTVCSRLLSRLATADARWAQLASDASTRSSPSDDRLPRSKGVSTGLWVPETLHTSRGLLILADQASEPDPVSDAVRLASRALGRCRSGAAWPRLRCGRWWL
jgi:hypothetical protein